MSARLGNASPFASAAIVAGGVRGLSIVSGFAFTSLLSFWLTKADYGVVATALSAALFACTFGEFGQRDLMAREISRAIAQGDEGRARVLGLWSLGVVAVTGAVAAAAVFTLLVAFGLWPGLAAGAALVTYALCFDGALSGIGRAHGQVFWALAPRDLLWRTTAMAIIMGLMSGGFQVGAAVAVAVLFFTMVGASALQYLALAPLMRGSHGNVGIAPLDRPKLLRASLDIGIGYVGGVILATLDVVLVGLILGPDAAAEYYPANRIAILVLSVPITLQVLFPASFAHLFVQNKLAELKATARRGALFATGGTLLAFVGVLLSKPVLPLLFDTATDQTWLVAVILSAGCLLNATCGFAGSILVAGGHESVIRRITLFSVPATAILLILAAVSGGQIAVALAVSAISTVRLLAVAYACHRRFGFAGSVLL